MPTGQDADADTETRTDTATETDTDTNTDTDSDTSTMSTWNFQESKQRHKNLAQMSLTIMKAFELEIET